MICFEQQVDLKALRKRKAPSVQLWGKQLKKDEKKVKRSDVLDIDDEDDEDTEEESDTDDPDSETSTNDAEKVCSL